MRRTLEARDGGCVFPGCDAPPSWCDAHHVIHYLPDGDTVRCVVDPQHAAQLTREHVTAAVHYITFQFTPAQVAAFVDGVVLAIDHPEYLESVELLPSTISELRADLT